MAAGSGTRSIALRTLTRADLPAIRELLADRCDLPDTALVAGEKLFGPAAGALGCEAFGAVAADDVIGVSASSGKWLRMLAVDPAARGRGIGTSLLAMAESSAAHAGATELRTLAQPGNYLSPGIDETDTETIAWFERRGYQRIARNTNLVIGLEGNPRVTPGRARGLAERARQRGYRIERARPADAPALAAAVAEEFSTGWAFEVERALRAEPPGVHVAIHDETDELAAFAAHDGNNRGLGWFGPAGTLAAHRGRGLGGALLLRCLLDVAEAGHDLGIISWIGPREFYARVAGVIGERHYVVLEKHLASAEEE